MRRAEIPAMVSVTSRPFSFKVVPVSTISTMPSARPSSGAELYGALDFDDAHVHGAAFKELSCDVRVFGRDGLRFVAAEKIRTLAAGERKAAAAEAKI